MLNSSMKIVLSLRLFKSLPFHSQTIALYVHPRNSKHLWSHSRAIMALDHSRLGHENKLLENKLGRTFLRSTSLLYKFLPTDLGVFKNNLLYFLYFLYITSELKQYYLSYRTRTECGISRFFKTNCTQSMFGTINRGLLAKPSKKFPKSPICPAGGFHY